jgi:integrase
MTERLTKKTIEKAVSAGEKVELRDALARGLVLRVWGPSKWSWNVRRSHRGKDFRLDLGNDWTLDQARDLANDVAVDVKKRHGLIFNEPSVWEEFIGSRRAYRDGLPYKPPPAPRPPPEPEGKLWRDAAAAWIAEVDRTRREKTALDYDACLRIAEFVPFRDRYVSTIKREEVAEAVAAIARRGAERQAETCAIAVRRFFAWLADDAQRGKYKVTPGLLAGLKAPERTLDEDDESSRLYVPDGEDIRRIVRWLRDPGSTPERDRLAGLLLVYSVQRRSAVAKARKIDFEPAGRHGGLWKLPPMHRKSASSRRRRGVAVGQHVIPLPPSAWAVVEQAMALAVDSDFLFPATRDRRKGKPALTMHADLLTHMFGGIADYAGSAHDIRRAFGTTYARHAKLTVYDVKMILDHSEGVEPGDVTIEHYMFVTGEHVKWPIMRGWCDWVDDQASDVDGLKLPRQDAAE